MQKELEFRKKPVVVKASQWFKNGDHPDDYAHDVEGLEGGRVRKWTGAYARELGWEGQIVRRYRPFGIKGTMPCEHCAQPMNAHGWIDALEGGHIVCPGDWIITGVKGERYPCKPDVFAATYEQVGEPNAHIDEAAVDSFASAMKLKLAQARAKGRHGWETCHPDALSAMLREHLEKGDPIDVANFCAFLWNKGYGISPLPIGAGSAPFKLPSFNEWHERVYGCPQGDLWGTGRTLGEIQRESFKRLVAWQERCLELIAARSAKESS